MFKRLLTFLVATFLLSGCTTFGSITNVAKQLDTNKKSEMTRTQRTDYSIESVMIQKPLGKTTLMLAFSGGGSRASALAYGVLQELRDTHIQHKGKRIRLLDEVDVISSVSGGSFTAAYYGLHGDRTFQKFESVFLRKDIESLLIEQALSPWMWFSDITRTDRAVEFYEETVFKGATFADLQKRNGPLIVINASDLGSGIRFSFTQEYFDLLCSDLNHFPLARAVTASSSVPVLFNPVILKKYHNCVPPTSNLLLINQNTKNRSQDVNSLQQGLQAYLNPKSHREYIHLVDGGITDNLGLRAIYDVMELAGGAKAMLEKVQQKPVGHFAVISVNASTKSSGYIGLTNQVPDIETTINAVSDIQLHRYNTATTALFQQGLKRWTHTLSNEKQTVQDYFIEVGFKDIVEPEKREFFNRIPTSFVLNKQQADELINAGRTLLRQHPVYKTLIKNLSTPEK